MAGGRSFTYELLEELGEEHSLGCKCCRFNKGIDLPIPKKLGKETEKCARELSTSIFKHWTQLNAIVKRFEGTIQKRWLKKSQKQKRELLLKAWPKISATHRPDFENFRNAKKQASRARTCHSEAYLWPHINLEDLQQRHLLLLFINSRGRNLPDTFRRADLKAAHVGDGYKPALDFIELTGLRLKDRDTFFEFYNVDVECMLFEKKRSPAEYGKVINRKTSRLNASQYKFLSRSEEGLLTLEIQERIYRFLYDCAKLVLHDISPSTFFTAPHQPEPEMLQVLKADHWPSLSFYALEAPYRVPQKLDLNRIKMLVSARRSMAEDHVWMLREDPAYFADTLRDWNEHAGQRSSKPVECSCTSCWNRIAGRVITQAYVSLICWGDIHDKLHAMPPIDVQIKRADERMGRFRGVDEDRWSALYEVLINLQIYPMRNLESGLPTSPRLRHRYRWVGEDDGDWQILPGTSEAERRVCELFTALKSPGYHSLHGLVQEIQYMLETDGDASQYVDSWITSQFSDLALLSELHQSIDGLAPWFDLQKAEHINSRPTVESQIDEVRNLTIDLTDGLRHACKTEELLWDPINNKKQFDYPVDKRRTKTTVEQMIKAEQNLDLLWWSIEVSLSDSHGIDLNDILEEHTFPPRELYRTRQWKEPIQLPSPQATPQKPLANIDPNVLRSSPFTQSTSPKTFDSTPPKEKVKTRGTPAAPDLRHTPQAEADNAEPPFEKVRIPKKAYKVFLALLPSSDDVVQQRCEIAWDDLLWAFDAVGLEPEKLYGSVWLFKPLPKEQQGPGKVKLDRSIQFHEPKEVRRGAKIPRPMVRTFGRRLRHAFDWGDADEMFDCE